MTRAMANIEQCVGVILLNLYPEADDFQNLRHILGKNFHDDPIGGFYVKLLADKIDL